MSVCLFTDGRRAAFSQIGGTAVKLTKAGRRSVFMQGDDAYEWRTEFDAADGIDDATRSHRAKIDLIERYFDL